MDLRPDVHPDPVLSHPEVHAYQGQPQRSKLDEIRLEKTDLLAPFHRRGLAIVDEREASLRPLSVRNDASAQTASSWAWVKDPLMGNEPTYRRWPKAMVVFHR